MSISDQEQYQTRSLLIPEYSKLWRKPFLEVHCACRMARKTLGAQVSTLSIFYLTLCRELSGVFPAAVSVKRVLLCVMHRSLGGA